MEAHANERTADADKAERRSFPRHAVDCAATVTPLSGAGRIAGRMVDLSLGGCRLSTPERVAVGILSRVEVAFQLRGITFRIVGVTAGTRTGRSFGIRFVELPARRAEELAEVIAEVSAAPAAGSPAMRRLPEPTASASPAPPEKFAESVQPAKPAPAPTSSVTPAPADRRAHNRHQVDTRVNLTLIKGAICMPGYILNLSQGGCRLRTDERFNVGIYARVEAEFFLHGLPFRLAGVSQAIMDRNTIGIHFLDMSDRKREQLTELIAEIAEAERKPAAQKSALPSAPAAS
jgi:c-di-GMP-binding flagellar brake protein YcgR